jgi:hypothetical protein
METAMKTNLTLFLGLTLLLRAAAGVLPPDAVVGGKTQAEWSAEAWKWVLPIPTNLNPNLDPDGSRANVNQPNGPIFFIGGLSQISTVVERHFTVPEGKYLFAPLISVFTDNVDTWPLLTIEEMRDFNSRLIDLVTGLHASIDGAPVPDLFSHRAASSVFSVEYLSPDNLGSVIYGHPITGVVDPMVAEGYYLMIEPLPPGRHVINLGANVGPPVNLYKDITDIITVVPVPLEQKVAELLAQVEAADISAKRKRVLEKTLSKAGTAFEKGKLKSGIHHLCAFQHHVRAWVSRLAPDLARDLISQAQAIIERARQGLRMKHHGDDDHKDEED